MHSLSRTMPNQHTSTIDRLAEWLLTNCPFSTLTILALLVLGFAFEIPRVPMVIGTVAALDLMLNLARRHRRARRARPVTA
jgi:hypothetical protein